jgi:hypothetical protein
MYDFEHKNRWHGLIALQRTGRRLTTQETEDDTCLTDLKNIWTSTPVGTTPKQTHSLTNLLSVVKWRAWLWAWRYLALPGLVDGFSPHRPVFDPVPVHLRFVVDDVSLRQGVRRVIHFSNCSIIPPMLYTHIRSNTAHKDKRASLVTINLLKPTGHVIHHQFNIQQLYVLHTLYLCVLYLSENKQRLVPLTA